MQNGNFLRNIWIIMKREIRRLFRFPGGLCFHRDISPPDWFFHLLYQQLFRSRAGGSERILQWHPWLFMFLVPSVAMRLWAEERRLGTIELLLTLPVTVTDVVLGKFLAAWCFIGIALALTFPLVLTVMFLGNPDLGVIFCAYLGSFLMAGTFLSVGSMTSALTRSQVVSFILAVVACLFLILAGFAPVTAVLSGWAPMWLVDLVSATSVLSHFASIARGVLDVRDLLYYLSVMVFMIVVNGVILQNRESA